MTKFSSPFPFLFSISFVEISHRLCEPLLTPPPPPSSVRVHRAATWILGEFAASAEDVQAVLTQVRQALGELPLVEDERRRAAGDSADEDAAQQQQQTVQKLVTADGTYATQSAFSAAP